MSIWFIHLYCILLITLTCLADKQEKKLKLVQVVYRHGERSPVSIFPKDQYNISIWKKFGAVDYGQLTWLGMQHQYELGEFFKKRYIEDLQLLGPDYDERQIYVRAADVDRCLMSAYCNLAGMFPPSGNTDPWNVNNTIKWQPIPVHTIPEDIDSELSQESVCPRADQLYLQVQQTDSFKKMSTDYKDLCSNVSQWSGVKDENLLKVWQVTDTLSCEKAEGLTMPNWTRALWPAGNHDKQTVYDVLMYLRGWEMEQKFAELQEQIKLRGGPLVKQMLANANLTINGTNTMTKFYMFSAHDTTLVVLMRAFGVFNGFQPPFASAIMFELYEDPATKEYFVSLLYRNDSSQNFTQLKMPGCDVMCPFSKILSMTADIIPSNWSQQCELPEKSSTNEDLVIGLGIGAGLLLLLLMVGIVYIIRKKRGDSRFADYYNVDSEE